MEDSENHRLSGSFSGAMAAVKRQSIQPSGAEGSAEAEKGKKIRKGDAFCMEDFFRIDGTDLTVRVPAELDHHMAEKIKKGSDRLIENRNIRRIIFDFQRTHFMDSSGIGMIMGRYKNMRFMGGAVIAVNVNDRIHRILTLSGIYKMIDIYESSC